jgi:MFS family permease
MTYHKATSQRLLYTLFILQSLYTASQIAVFTLVVIMAVRIAGTESVAGMPSTVLTMAQAFFALPIASFMGRHGRRLGLTIGYLIGALGGLFGVLAITYTSLPLLLLSAACIGMGRASSDQGRFVAGEIFPEAERARMIGRVVFAGTIGAVLGPALVAPSGQFLESIGQSADMGPWAMALVLCGLAALLTFLTLRPDPMEIADALSSSTARQTNSETEATARPLSALFAMPMVRLAVISVLISQTVMVVLMAMTPLYMDHHQHARSDISFVISMHTLGMFGLSPLTGYLIDRFGRIAMLFMGALTMIASALLAPISINQFVLAVALFLLGLGWNFCYVAGTSLLSDTLQGAERTRVQGINDSLVFFVAGLGSLGAGPLFAIGDYSAVAFAALLANLVLVGIIFWYNRPQLKAKHAAIGD